MFLRSPWQNRISMEKEELEKTVGEIHKSREKMSDGERYIIFYTFGDENQETNEVRENV